MKKILISMAYSVFFLSGFFIVFGLLNNAQAIEQENMEGSPDDNENHFIWGIMSQLQTPDDSDCNAVAQTELLSEGIAAGEAAIIATEACAGIASMRTNMESDMSSGGEGAETNLWEATDWHAVENLYFEHSTNGVADGRIAFSQPIDFMSYAFMNFMMNFRNNMQASQGYISLNADTVGGFADYGATLTMYNVPEFDDPIILVDGEEDAEGIVSNLVYNREDNTLTFSADHFSSFEAVESSSLNAPDIKKIKVRKFISSNGHKKVRVVVRGKKFDKDVEIKLGSRDSHKTRRDVKKGMDKVEAHFNLDDLLNSGHRKLTVHVINPEGSTTDYSDKVDLKDIKALKLWKYEKIYKDHEMNKRQSALGFVNNNLEYYRP